MTELRKSIENADNSTLNVAKSSGSDLPEDQVLSIMDMPPMTGVALTLQGSRRGSMFASHDRLIHGSSRVLSRGSFSMKGKLDPAVSYIDESQRSKPNVQEYMKDPNRRVHPVVSEVNNLVYFTESKDSLNSQAARRKQLAPQFENSYQIDPKKKPTRKELSDMFERVLAGVPPGILKGGNLEKCNALGQDLANKVIAECQELGLERYRFLCMSTVVSRNGASTQQASRQLWDLSRDTWEETTLKLDTAYIYLQVYCVYLD